MTNRLPLAVVVLIPLALAGCGKEEAVRATIPTAPSTPTPPTSTPTPAPGPITTVTVVFGGRVVDADAGGPVANARVSVSGWGSSGPEGEAYARAIANEIATSGADGTFTLPLNLPSDWTHVVFQFTGPAGYDTTHRNVEPTSFLCVNSPWCWAAAHRPAIRLHPTLMIRPGESIDVRVDRDIVRCGFGGAIDCRRVLVAASPGDSVELEIVAHDSSKPMGLGENDWTDSPELRRLMVAPGGGLYVVGAGTATLTARR